MPRRKSNLGARTRQTEAVRRVIARQSKEERAASNERNRRRMTRTRANETLKQPAAGLEYGHLTARRTRSAASGPLRSGQNKSHNRLAVRNNLADGTTRCKNLKCNSRKFNAKTKGKIKLPQLGKPPEPVKIFLVENKSSLVDFAEEDFETGNIPKLLESYEEITAIKTEVTEESYDSEAVRNELELLDTKANITSKHSLLTENETIVKLEKKWPTDNLDILTAAKKTSKAMTAEGDVSLAENFTKESLEKRNVHKFSEPPEDVIVMKTEVKEESYDSTEIGNELELLDTKTNVVSEHLLLSENDTKHSDVARKYKCADCEYCTHTKESLGLHMKTHIKEKSCDSCEFVTNNAHILRYHRIKNHSDKVRRYKCEECKFSTDQRYHLKRHIGSHAKEKEFKCNVCEYSAARKHNLIQHVYLRHSGAEKNYKCNACEYASSSKYNLQTHTLLKHFV